jgi:hypothetical protein
MTNFHLDNPCIIHPILCAAILILSATAPTSAHATEAVEDSSTPVQPYFNLNLDPAEEIDLEEIDLEEIQALLFGQYLTDADESTVLNHLRAAKRHKKRNYFNAFLEALYTREFAGKSILRHMILKWDKTAYNDYSFITQWYYRFFAAHEIPKNTVAFHHLFDEIFSDRSLHYDHARHVFEACNERYTGNSAVIGDQIQTDFYFLVSRQGTKNLSVGTLAIARQAVQQQLGKSDHNGRIDQLRELLK